MTEFILRRIANNKWLFLCLLLGALSASAIVSAIPMYSAAILQKVLTKELENSHMGSQVSPGTYSVVLKGDGFFDPELLQNLEKIDTFSTDNVQSAYRFPIEDQVSELRYTRLFLRRDGDEFFNGLGLWANPTSISELERHVRFIDGGMPSKTPQDGVYEAVMSMEAMKSHQLMKDTVYSLCIVKPLTEEETEVLNFKIVGIFTIDNKNELYWSNGRYDQFKDNLILDREILTGLFDGSRQLKLEDYENTCYYDYTAIKISQLPEILSTYDRQQQLRGASGFRMLYLQFPVVNILKGFGQREDQLNMTLMILIVPLMVVLCFYAMILSNQIVKNDKNEIALLRSRGAKRSQIFFLYIAQCLILSAFSLLSGPYLGKLICTLIGSSNGFLEFIGRKALITDITAGVYLYALLAVFVFSLFVLIPVFRATNTNIVQHKRSLLFKGDKPIWKRFYLDFLFLGLSVYGFYNFKLRSGILKLTGLTGSDIRIDPFVFFISALFIIGTSLIFLRFYPLLIRLVFLLGYKRWHPVLYFSLASAGKAERNMQSIMLFLILTLSFGILNANQARTINSNAEDKIMYKNGADIVIEPYNNLNHLMPGTQPGASAGVPYIEPPYNKYTAMAGIGSITRVIRRNDVAIMGPGGRIKNIGTLGIRPCEFGKTAWFRSDLLPHPINEYLNIMTNAPTAILLSSDFKTDYGYKIGDTISVMIGSNSQLECRVYGFVDYFPTYYPYDENGKSKLFAVLNYDYLSDKLPAMPYEIWIKKQPGTTDGAINQQILDNKLKVDNLTFSGQEIIKQKNDPVLLGTNGVLTMCFILTLMIAFMGFMIFWTLTVKERALKFGIFRAIGMPMWHVTLIMVCEQLLISGAAVFTGFLIGNTASRIFIPLLEIIYSSSQVVPKFRLAAETGDYIKIFVITLIMLLSGLVVLSRIVKNIKVNQVIKLGEDS